MSRPIDAERRQELIARSLPYLAEHGLAQLSLRPLAAALGTTDRMLIHYFGSKEAMIGRILAETRPDVPQLSATQNHHVGPLAHQLWSSLTTPGGDQQVRVRLLLQVMTLALTQPDPYLDYARDAVHAWIGPLAAALQSGHHLNADEARARATTLVSGIRGIALDRFLTDDAHRTNQAVRLLIQAATAPPK